MAKSGTAAGRPAAVGAALGAAPGALRVSDPTPSATVATIATRASVATPVTMARMRPGRARWFVVVSFTARRYGPGPPSVGRPRHAARYHPGTTRPRQPGRASLGPVEAT